MIKADLITGFLGSGKTSFICDYPERLCAEGIKSAVIVKDYGAVNVDRLFLEKRIGHLCHVDMVIAGDPDCARRRLKTKLISLAMDRYERVILEPSGIYNADDFLDLIYDDALERWYSPGSIITLVDAGMCGTLGKNARYVLASQAAKAGVIVITKTEKLDLENDTVWKEAGTESVNKAVQKEIRAELENKMFRNETAAGFENSIFPDEIRADRMKKAEAYILACLEEFGCKRKDFVFVERAGQKLDDEKYELIKNAAYRSGEMQHLSVTEDGSFESAFFYKDEDINVAEASCEAENSFSAAEDFYDRKATSTENRCDKNEIFTEGADDKKLVFSADIWNKEENNTENDIFAEIKKNISKIFTDNSYGTVYRVKGFVKIKEGWLEVNAMKNSTEISHSDMGQAVFIAIGEHLNREKLKEVFDLK